MKIDFAKGNGLVPAIIQDAVTNKVLMLGFMNEEAFQQTQNEKRVTFFSRTKNRLWTKGEESGNYLNVVSIQIDCDNDTLLIKVNPAGVVCHTGADTCWNEKNEKENFDFLTELEHTIEERKNSPAQDSYTSKLFADGINKVAQKVGEEASVSWPTGVGGKGNEGVASYVKQIKGSIGYVEYAYALQNKMSYTMLQNKEGVYVSPNEESFKSAAAGAHWDTAPGFYEILTDEPGKKSWPITGATFILMHKSQANAENAKTVLKFFEWAYAEGGKLALDLDYIPMPKNVVKLVENAWKTQLKDASGKALW